MLTGRRPVAAAAACLAVATASALAYAFPAYAFPASAVAARPLAPAGFGASAGRRLVKELRAAWQITQGRGVRVAVVGGGVDGGAAGLAGKVKQGPAFGPTAYDSDALGTAFASGVAGAGPSSANTTGRLGLAPAAKVLALRIPEGKNAADWQDAEGKAIRYAVRHHAQVICVLLVGYSDTAALAGAVQYASEHGAIVIGDEYKFGRNGNGPEFPDSLPGVLNAGSVILPGMPRPPRRSASPVNESVLLAAPGNELTVSGPAGQQYLIFNGLSAQAWLAATVVMMKSVYPGLTAAAADRALAASARRPGPGGYSTTFGFGLIDPVGALRAAHALVKAPQTAAAGGGVVAPTRRVLPGPAPAAVVAVHNSAAVLAGLAAAAAAGAVLLLLALALPMRWRWRARAAGGNG